MSQFPLHRLLAVAVAAILSSGVLVLSSGPTPAPAAASAAAVPAPVHVTGLTVNGRSDPLGIPGGAPSFGWHGESTGRGVVQTAYQIQVATTEAKLSTPDVWDSQKTTSSRQVDVLYAGPALKSQTRYVWWVRTWDGQNNVSEWSAPGSFETGMLSPADWGGAEWIGAPDIVEYDRLVDYWADFTFTIKNQAFGAFIAASNINNGYLWQIAIIDGTPRFRPHERSGGQYHLLANVDISSAVSAAALTTGPHTMRVVLSGTTVTTSLDGRMIDTRTIGTPFVPPKGWVGLRTSGSEAALVESVKVFAGNGTLLLKTDFSSSDPFVKPTSPFGVGRFVSGGLEINGSAEGLWQSPDTYMYSGGPSWVLGTGMPLLRTEFSTAAGKTLTRARIYATARGVYQLRLNGLPVGDQQLAPGWTDYHKRIQHQTYDVTSHIKPGEVNAWGAELGRGWYAGRLAHIEAYNYGARTSLLARLRLDYSDGTTQWVDTDDTTWRTRPGPYVASDLIDGESYDARLEQPGWQRASYSDSGWNPALTRSTDKSTVVPQPDDPVRVTQVLPAVKRTTPTTGRHIFDMGQNMVGVARVVLTGKAGTTATIRYGEELNPDGTLYTANLRSAKATDTYTFAVDGTASYTPLFTQHGFRYVEISGVQAPPSLSQVTGMVWGSDLRATGSLETSSQMLNQLLSNISWGQRGNFLSIPTDTPARDERLGWSGDINVFAPTASYLRDTRAFLGKWMADLVDAQEGNDFTAVAPALPGHDLDAGAGWADAGITVPYAVWQATGDATVIRQNWEAMRKFFMWVRSWAEDGYLEDGRPYYLDWLHLNDPTPKGVIGTAYFAQDARMMSEMAGALGKTADMNDFANLYQGIRRAFTAAYVSTDGTVSGNSQTGYAMALGMGLVTDEVKAKVGAKYVAKISASGDHLTTGFLGTPLLLPALTAVGRDDVAWKLLMRTQYPSWGYEVAKGATTVWERWNSIMPDGSFGDVSMNSFNHYAYGAVGDWMYRNIGAIAPAAPGYKKIRIEPRPGGGVDHAEGTYESVYGTIHTDWTTFDNDNMNLAVDVPVNTTADVVLPGATSAYVSEGGLPLSQVAGVLNVTAAQGKVTVTVGSGSYRFTASAVLGPAWNRLVEIRGDLPQLVADGRLTAAQSSAFDAPLGRVQDDLKVAMTAESAGDQAAQLARLRPATREVRDLRVWLMAAGVEASTVDDLDARLAWLEWQLSNAVSGLLNVTIRLTLPTTPGLRPGVVANAEISLWNGKSVELQAFSGSVRVGSWAPVRFERAPVAGPAITGVPVAVRVPDGAVPGSYDAEASVSFELDGKLYELNHLVTDWAKVDSGLQIGTITVAPGSGDPIGRATLKVPVTNTRPVTAAVRAQISSSLPSPWKSVPSPIITVPPGGTATASIPVVVPYDRLGNLSVPATVAVTNDQTSATLASKEYHVKLGLAVPPSVATLDHVDFGSAASEQAHAVTGSPSSGTDTIGGYTRRYSHIAYPGSWFSADLKVTPGQPFILRNREVFGGLEIRRYEVYVDDVLVRTVANPPDYSVQPGSSTSTYDLLVDTPAALAATADGKVTVKYLFPPGSSGDPSLTDTWVLRVPPDTLPPLVFPPRTTGVEGEHGWYRSDVEVRFDAVDNGNRTPNLWVQRTPELSSSFDLAPVIIWATEQGANLRYYWASNDNQNFTPRMQKLVQIDSIAPVTELFVVPSATGSELRFQVDGGSSGAWETLYRIDGGAWRVLGPTAPVIGEVGQHTVEYTSTDWAGNHEVKRTTSFTVAGS